LCFISIQCTSYRFIFHVYVIYTLSFLRTHIYCLWFTRITSQSLTANFILPVLYSLNLQNVPIPLFCSLLTNTCIFVHFTMCSISQDLISFGFFRCLCSISQELLKFCFRCSCFISNEALTGLFSLNANVLYFLSPVFY
jgi:hypothetical protein